jgi:transposase
MVEEDSPARQIDRMVDEADTSYFEKSETKGKGRPPFDPKDLLKLYVYGFENGIYSSRKLERECKRNTEAMWLLKGLQPDDKTVSNFRKENAGSIKRFFDEFCVKLARAGYMDGKVVSVDGTKIRANNSKRNNYSLKKLNRQIEYVNGRLAEYMTELDKNDEIEKLQARRVKYEGYKKQIESGAVTEVSATDPDSRMMKQGNNGVDVSYNVQTAVDGKHKLIAGILVTNEPNDQGQLHKVSKSVKDNLGFKEMTVPADKGYYDTDDIKACHDDNITTLVAKPDVREAERGFFKKQDFKYLPEDDVFVCPAGAKLKGSKPDDNGYKRYRNSKACSHCPLKDKCTTGDRKDLGRHQYAEHTEQNDSDFKNNQHIYKQRQQLSEHPFGTVKRTMGFRQFLTRGTANVTAETALIFLIYNLKRLRGINKNDNKTDGEPVALLRLFAGLFTSFAIFHCHSNLFRLSLCPYPFFTQSAVPLTGNPSP